VLLIVDQAEELFGNSDTEAAHKADRLLRLLRGALEQDGDVPSPVETRRRLSDPVSHVISVSAASL
jgi:hypothetical protein